MDKPFVCFVALSALINPFTFVTAIIVQLSVRQTYALAWEMLKTGVIPD